jgi:L-threonylcarbamoyladenylate synthase
MGLESTVLSLVHTRPTILRPGAVTQREIEALLRETVDIKHNVVLSTEPLLSPGLLARHYSPLTPVLRLSQVTSFGSLPSRVGAIRFSAAPPPFVAEEVRHLSDDTNLGEVANRLFAALRELDKLGLDLIVVDECESVDLGAAIMDRLLRATSE